MVNSLSYPSHRRGMAEAGIHADARLFRHDSRVGSLTMQVVLRSSSLFLTLVGIVSNARVAKVEATLRRGVVGRLRVGMSVEELEAEAQPAVLDDSSANSVKIYFGSNSGEQPTLSADIADGVVSQFRIFPH